MIRLLAIVLLTLGSVGGCGRVQRVEADPVDPPKAPNPPTTPVKEGRHALLVGCTEYPNLDKKFWLNGPGNDVQLMAKMLRDKFGFAPERIVILSDEVAKTKKDDKLLPTKANVQREFEQLAKVSKEGDKVVILLGGHGSQQPEGPNTPNPKPDGLNEIFLPRDVGPWDDAVGKVTNAVVDHELGTWLKKIQDTKATVWITVDACHSGTITRDVNPNPVEKSREINGVNVLKVPEKAVAAATARAQQRNVGKRGGPVEPTNYLTELSKKSGGLVAIYACLASETTLERDMPLKSKDAKPYGLLTYTLVQTILQASESSSKPLTYRELLQRIQSQYFAMGRTAPTPLIEGADTDREVLGEKHWPGRSDIVLAKGDNGLKVTAGTLRGLTPGSILAVTPPPGQGDKVLGHVKITELRTTDADVEPCAFEKSPLVAKLPRDGVGKVAFVDYGDQLLRLAFDPRSEEGKVLDMKDQQRLLKTLGQLNEPKVKKNPKDPDPEPRMARLVTDPAEAEWFLRPYKDGKLVLAPALGQIKSAEKPTLPRLLGPYADDEKLLDELDRSLTTIAHYENLKKLVAGFTDEGGDQGVKLKVEIRRGEDETDREGKYPIPYPNTNVSFYNQDLVGVKVTNPSRVPVDFTVLYMSSDYSIDCLWPTKDQQVNRLGPNESQTFRPVPVSATVRGMEHLVVIGVKGQGQSVSFGYLAQPGLMVARATIKPKALESALGKLFQKSLYNDSRSDAISRGMKMAEVDDFCMTMMSWEMRPEKRPPEKK